MRGDSGQHHFQNSLIARRPDPSDRRRVLVELTADGRATLQSDRRQREGWLARAIVEQLSAKEQRTLREAVAVLRRLAES